MEFLVLSRANENGLKRGQFAVGFGPVFSVS